MKNKLTKTIAIPIAALIAVVALLSIGYMLGKREQERRFADQLIGQMSLSVGALLHLEREQYAYAKDAIATHVDIDISSLTQLESVELDDAGKQIRSRVLRSYAQVRGAREIHGSQHPDMLEAMRSYYAQIDAYIEKYKSDAPSTPAPDASR